MRRSCLLAIVVVFGSFIMGRFAFADLRGDMKTVFQKHGPGEEVAVYGKMIPSTAFAEWKRAQKALKDARISLLKVIGKAQMVDRVPEWATQLSGRLDALTEDFNLAVLNSLKEKGELYKADQIMKQGMVDLLMEELGKFKNELVRLQKELDMKVDKDEGWAFGLAMYGSGEYGITKRDLMPIGGVGLTASWRKATLTLDMLIGAGVSVIDGPAVSWTFIPSLQFILAPRFSVGPAMVMTQDLGNMEGADRWVWQGGIKIKTNVFGINVWAIPSFGIHGERGYGKNGPTYSPNVGFTLGIEKEILK